MSSTSKAELDVVIIGGGVQGLVALNALVDAGYSCALVSDGDDGGAHHRGGNGATAFVSLRMRVRSFRLGGGVVVGNRPHRTQADQSRQKPFPKPAQFVHPNHLLKDASS